MVSEEMVFEIQSSNKANPCSLNSGSAAKSWLATESSANETFLALRKSEDVWKQIYCFSFKLVLVKELNQLGSDTIEVKLPIL